MKSKYRLHIILLPFNEKASKEISVVLKAAVHTDTCGMVMNILFICDVANGNKHSPCESLSVVGLTK